MMDHGRQSERHVAAAQRRLTHLAGLAEKTAATERNILSAAEDRLGSVNSDLAKLAPRVNLDPDAAESYQDRALERGRLSLVIARARQVLAE